MRPRAIIAIVLLLLVGVAVMLAQEVFTPPTTPSIQVVGTNIVLSASFPTIGSFSSYQAQLFTNDSPSLPSNGCCWFNAGSPITAFGGTATWSYTNVGAASLTQQFYWLRIEVR
jgi:hypothetical protein